MKVNDYITHYEAKMVKVSSCSDKPTIQFNSSSDIIDVIRSLMAEYLTYQEQFYAFYLNRKNCLISWKLISMGSTSATIVDTKIVVKHGIDAFCSSVILAHNHPSNNTKPSDNDINISIKIKKALDLFDIVLLDHVIITEDNYLSLADEGLL